MTNPLESHSSDEKLQSQSIKWQGPYPMFQAIKCWEGQITPFAYFAEQADGEVLEQLVLEDERLFQLTSGTW